MVGITTSPQFRESPETANLQAEFCESSCDQEHTHKNKGMHTQPQFLNNVFFTCMIEDFTRVLRIQCEGCSSGQMENDRLSESFVPPASRDLGD